MSDYNNPRHNYRVSGKTLSGAGEGGKKTTSQCYKRGGKVMRDNDHDADDYARGGSVKQKYAKGGSVKGFKNY